MTLTDAGPLVALIDAGEADHDRCVNTLRQLSMPLLTTWPTFTEAIYLLGSASGWPGQKALWELVLRGDLVLATPSIQRSAQLMECYADRPMDLADATLVALAEERNLNRIFSLDADFYVYRLNERIAFEVLPRGTR